MLRTCGLFINVNQTIFDRSDEMVDLDLSSTYKDRLLRVSRPTAGGVSEIGTSDFNAIPVSGEGNPDMKRTGVL